jgi:hypothetical protein
MNLQMERSIVSYVVSALALVLALGAGNASATVIQGTACALTDATFGVENADDCIGILLGENGGEINPSEDLLNNKLNALGDIWTPGAFDQTDWEFLTKDEGVGGAFGFSVEASSCGIDLMCDWTLDPGLTGEFLLAVKQGTLLNLYLYDAEGVSVMSGYFNVAPFGDEGNLGWSNVSIYTRDGGFVPERSDHAVARLGRFPRC